MARQTKLVKRVCDPAGGWWEASEAYAWEPMRQAAPTSILVFRGGGHELRASGAGPLATLDDAALSAVLAGLLPAPAPTPLAERALRPAARTVRVGPELRLRSAAA